MSKPIIADNKPMKVSLTKGQTYSFCSCGRSAKQPFCDGSHAGSGLTPTRFVAEKEGDAYLCVCKHSAKVPFCDSTHKQFDDSRVGKE